MDRRRGATQKFEDFDPQVVWKQAGEDRDVVEIALPGFRKDQVRVQVDNHRVLRATGERPARGGRWTRFTKDLRLPENCDPDAVRARFEDEKLIITLPFVAPAPDEALPPESPVRETSPSPSPTPSPPLRRATPGTVPDPKVPDLQEWEISVSPPPEQQLPYTKAPEEGSKISEPPPAEEEKKKKPREETGGEVRDKVEEEAVKTGTPLEKQQQAEGLPAVGEAPATTVVQAPEPARQLVVNTVAAVVVLVGIIMAVWRTLSS